MIMCDLSANWNNSYRELEQRILSMEQKLDELSRCFRQTSELLSQVLRHRSPEIRYAALKAASGVAQCRMWYPSGIVNNTFLLIFFTGDMAPHTCSRDRLSSSVFSSTVSMRKRQPQRLSTPNKRNHLKDWHTYYRVHLLAQSTAQWLVAVILYGDNKLHSLCENHTARFEKSFVFPAVIYVWRCTGLISKEHCGEACNPHRQRLQSTEWTLILFVRFHWWTPSLPYSCGIRYIFLDFNYIWYFFAVIYSVILISFIKKPLLLFFIDDCSQTLTIPHCSALL